MSISTSYINRFMSHSSTIATAEKPSSIRVIYNMHDTSETIKLQNMTFENHDYSNNLFFTHEIEEKDYFLYAIKKQLINKTNKHYESVDRLEFSSSPISTNYTVYLSSDNKEALMYFSTYIAKMCLQMIYKKYTTK